MIKYKKNGILCSLAKQIVIWTVGLSFPSKNNVYITNKISQNKFEVTINKCKPQINADLNFLVEKIGHLKFCKTILGFIKSFELTNEINFI